MKDSHSWHYGLQAALSGELGDRGNQDSGLSYQDYLRIFLMMTELDLLTARAMNMVEADMRISPGNENFRLDACYDKWEAVTDFSSSFGYKFRIQREKAY